jgi:undecaprenyl-diphosphatase
MKLQGEKRDRARLVVIFAAIVAAFFAFRQFGPDIDVEQILEDLSSWLGQWTYVLVGLLAFLETGAGVGLVFPGETAVILGGAVAGQGETSIVITIAIVWACAWGGDTTSFFIGRRLGREFILEHGSKVLITHERFEQVEKFFQSHGGKTILIGRFIGLVRALAPFIAGSSGMAYRAFLPYSVLGTGLWATAFSLLGYLLANSLDKATQIAGTGALVFGALVAIVVGFVVVSRYLRKAENRNKVVERLESTPVIRRLMPELRFLWNRVTPGGLGLEFTSLMAVLAVALFVLIGYALIVSDDAGPTPGDTATFDVVEAISAPWLTDVAKVVTQLGSVPVTVGIAIVAAVVLGWQRNWVEFGVLVAATIICIVGFNVIKDVVDRPRPDGGLVGVSGSSYPSGHATMSVLYTWMAMTVAFKLRPGWAYGTALVVVGLVVTAAVGLSRVYLDVHYLSDVSGGWGLGAAAFAGSAAVALIIGYLRHNHGRRMEA